MANRSLIRGCELHLHILGAYHAEDLLELGRDCYKEVNWDEFDYINAYRRAYGTDPQPIALFDAAVKGCTNGVDRLKRAYTFDERDGGDFGRFEAKQLLFLSVWSHWRTKGRDKALIQRMLTRHRTESLDYVEYRCGSGLDGFLYWHRLCAGVLRESCRDGLTARYILSVPRVAPLETYALTQQLFDENPELVPIIVGIDFAGREEFHAPKHMRTLFSRVREDNRRNPERALDIVYHVGESFFDKSLESAVRWCHEVADMGAKRIGHAIALGLDPEVAVTRRTKAHVRELVSERLDQIAYDLRHAQGLSDFGIDIDECALIAERDALERRPDNESVERLYDQSRLNEVRRRQEFVLDRLIERGTVIECCPTSNLRIGGVPDPMHHPIHRFLNSNVNLAICSDDPGNFGSTLSEEVDWVLTHTGMTEDALERRLGDPRRFRLGQSRPRPAARG